MKTIELHSTELSRFNLTLYEGEAVLRNQNRINGLIGVRYTKIPEQFHNLLAKGTFSGTAFNEKVTWSTDIFENTPSKLSDLSGTEHEKYSMLLKDALQFYAQAFSDAETNVKEMLYAAITYASESTVYCANDKIVITEWGMKPKSDSKVIGMPYAIGLDNPKVEKPNKSISEKQSEDSSGENTTDTEDKPEDAEDVKRSFVADGNTEDAVSTETSETFDSNNEQSSQTGDNKKPLPSDNQRKKWKKWLLLLLGLHLILLLIFCLSKCKPSSPGILPVAPELDSINVELDEDSIVYVANNRLIILVTNDNTTVEQFAKKFREKYADDEKYILSNADDVIKRVTLTLPKEELEQMEQSLPTDFPDFGIIVLPESMYQNSYKSNDPFLKDANKSWYFDLCAVYDAWDVTMGSSDIIVAIIDDGFDLNHPEFRGKIVKPYNAVYHNSNVFASKSGHGTHVAATAIGLSDNSTGISGIAPKCKFMPIQVGDAQGRMASSAIFDAVIYAINSGADVVNMSLGMSFGPFVQFAPLYIQKNLRAYSFKNEEMVWNKLFNLAKQKNITFVLAGGNENCIIGLDPMQRSTNVIKVSAVQPDKQKAKFSNYGDMSTLSAPGVQIYNAIPGNRYDYMDGTSMASPIVAGGCALLKSANLGISTFEIAQTLRKTGITSTSNIGPIVNFAKALNFNKSKDNKIPIPNECEKINKRYNELLAELEKLRREHPGCIQKPDTMKMDENLTLKSLNGRWKSTSSLQNRDNEEVVIYFTFNGTSTANLDIVEPDGTNFHAPLSLSIVNDQVYINQTAPATNSNGEMYNPYKFTLKPDANRKASGNAKNKVEVGNVFDFKLTRI